MNQQKKLFDLRENYSREGLSINEALQSPFAQFNQWMEQAIDAKLPEPNAMTLATASKTGNVSARTVLLKEVDSKGFVFFTNYNSHKARDIKENPGAALVFLWLELERQVRIEGTIETISPVDSDLYFKSRPRESQLGAWASDQSTEIQSKNELEEKYAQLEKIYSGKPIPRPPHWGGYRLLPEKIEFWQGRPGRMHDRILYVQTPQGWSKKLLAP